ncbi:dienelactone hydrolase family protein [Mucilaginibacter pallidiroseus]|uniref:Dienelactone hydrolase family protein n=1 Tax=Mucilaginibacter pallidiroseus TaxID=2599295 RepID=A0A563UGX7_9SPHI|nr:dienelactone hydrolase family protein [Mucilaginibacter pallidiroseus]TWR30617.1 dienelactone hydrolase family protein [Mucilaginibacter pallidiroseus]
MKKLFLLAALLICGAMAFAQQMACCKKSATQQFAMLASDAKFRSSHKNPVKMHFQSAIGSQVNYKTPDGKTASAWMLKAKKPTNNYLFIIHEWYGLNDYVKREAEKLYNDVGNVNVIALDLYDGKVADNREDAGKYMQAVSDARAKAIIKGAIAYAGTKARIATLGWCFGGGWSLQATLLLGKQAAGCVMYYGMPEQDVAKLKTLTTDVLGNFANKDQFINTKVVAKFVADMKAAGKKLYLHQYNADHGFANPSNPIYDSAATKNAYANTLTFLKARLK